MQVTDEMIETACAHHWPGPWPGDRSEQVLAIRREDMRLAITAALSNQERAVEVKIKPLEWDDDLGEDEQTAFPLFGQYYLRREPDGRFGLRLNYACGADMFQTFIGPFDAMEAAQAAAQADYEQRIRSALVDVPVEPVARKFKLGDHVCKTKGSSWIGHVVGFYTPVGYAVESSRERGSVQIYPEAALKLIGPSSPHREGEDSAEVIPADPTEDMIDAALAVDWECDGDERAAAINVWHAMRSAALAATRSASATSANEGRRP